MKIAVVEYLSGGGLSERTLSSSVLSEGYSMLHSVLRDFKEAGYCTSTLLDSRLAKFQPPLKADRIYVTDSYREFKIKFKDLLKDSDASFLIAPESDCILIDLLRLSEEIGVASINCTIPSIVSVSNKLRLYKKLEDRGFIVPETRCVKIDEGLEKAQEIVEEMDFPLVIKPIESIGCCGLSILYDVFHLPKAINKIMMEAGIRTYLIQKLVRGVHASVSLISNKGKAIPLTLNLQMIALNRPRKISEYIGGLVPLDHTLKEVALYTAKRAVELFRGLRGYVGVDIVLSKSGPVLIEINPRLTVSYLGLREVSNLNVAKMMVEASLENRLPGDFNTSGCALFSKQILPLINKDLLKETYKMKEVLAPPFPINNNNYAFYITKGRDIKEAKIKFTQVKNRLRRIVESDVK